MSELTAETEIERLEAEIADKKERLHELQREQPREPVGDHELVDWDGEAVTIRDLMGDRDDLLVVHNMGTACQFCTMWADVFDGVLDHIEDRSAFVVVSPDDPATQREFAAERGWDFRMVSDRDGAFTAAAGFSADEHLVPGVSSYHRREDGEIVRVATDTFGPHDEYDPVWPLFELLADGPDGWEPQFSY